MMFESRLRHGIQFLTLTTLLLLSSWSAAEDTNNSKTFGDYEVMYSVFNSTFLKPDIAARYNIVRGKDQAVINVAVRKHLPGGESVAQPVEISGTTSDLIHALPLSFREVREQDAIYYLAEFHFTDKELRSFTLSIQPDPKIEAYTLKFSKKLYEEE